MSLEPESSRRKPGPMNNSGRGFPAGDLFMDSGLRRNDSTNEPRP